MPQFLTDPSITLRGLREPESPWDMLTRFAQLQQLQQTGRLNRLSEEEANLRLEQLRRLEGDKSAMRAATAAGVRPGFTMPAGGAGDTALMTDVQVPTRVDRSAIVNRLAQISPHQVLGVQADFAGQEVARKEAHLKMAEAATKLSDAQLSHASKVTDQLAWLLRSVEINPASYPQARAKAIELGMRPEELPEQFTPELLPAFRARINQSKEVLTFEQTERKNKREIEMGGSESDKWVRDYLASNNLPDTPQNRQKGREDYIKKTKTEPGMLRVEGFAETRGPIVTDKNTGITAPMSWAEYNRLSKKEPGRYVAPQYDPETQTNILAWRDLAKGKTKDQVTSYDTFLRHTGDLWDAIDMLAVGRSPLLNRPLNWLRTNMANSPEVKALFAKLDPVQKEFQSFLLNNRALYEDDRRVAQEMMNENVTPAQMRAVLSSMAHTGDARLQALNESFKRATGEDIPALYSAPASAVLKKVGVQAGSAVGGAQPAPEGTIIEVNGQRQIKRGGKWVPF